jgi:hypothetical protein
MSKDKFPEIEKKVDELIKKIDMLYSYLGAQILFDNNSIMRDISAKLDMLMVEKEAGATPAPKSRSKKSPAVKNTANGAHEEKAQHVNIDDDDPSPAREENNTDVDETKSATSKKSAENSPPPPPPPSKKPAKQANIEQAFNAVFKSNPSKFDKQLTSSIKKAIEAEVREKYKDKNLSEAKMLTYIYKGYYMYMMDKHKSILEANKSEYNQGDV